MAYDRYDTRRPSRDSRSRFPEERYDRSPESGTSRNWDARFERDDRDDRGFFERAGDEIASWFGDDDAERRRQFDHREDRYDRSPRAARDDDDGFVRSTRRFGEESGRRPYTGPIGSRRGFGDTYSADRAYQNDRWDRGSTQRDTSSLHDPHYSEWRRRQIDALDRDYAEYRRENQDRFENEFSSWRSTRQTKRGLLDQVNEHMEVVGSDNEPVGKVDKVIGDRVVLTRSDSPDGKHHALTCSLIDRVEDGKLILDKPADEARRQLYKASNRDRFRFENDRDRDDGPHMLNRAFSGTY